VPYCKHITERSVTEDSHIPQIKLRRYDLQEKLTLGQVFVLLVLEKLYSSQDAVVGLL
jgi:hypothetical protein